MRVSELIECANKNIPVYVYNEKYHVAQISSTILCNGETETNVDLKSCNGNLGKKLYTLTNELPDYVKSPREYEEYIKKMHSTLKSIYSESCVSVGIDGIKIGDFPSHMHTWEPSIGGIVNMPEIMIKSEMCKKAEYEKCKKAEYEKYKKEKEKNMSSNLLKIYKDKRKSEYNSEFRKSKENLLSKDETAKVINKFNSEVKKLIEAGQDESLDIITIQSHYIERFMSKETRKKINKLETELKDKEYELENLINEISAQLELCENYEQKMEILYNYNIIDKESKKVK